MLQKPQEIKSHKSRVETHPLVSICCLTYAHEDFIEDAIEGFLMQKTSFKVEILIHDDASPDKTPEKVRAYELKYPKLIKAVYQKDNQYSKGIDPFEKFLFPLAKGTYIALCEGDDYWTDPVKLQNQVEYLKEHPDFSTCVGGYSRLFEDTKKMEEVVIDKKSSNYKHGFEFTLQQMQHDWLTKTLTAVFRKKVLEEIELSHYNYTRDIHLFYHLIKNNKAFYFSRNFGVYRIHKGGVNSMKQGKINQNAVYNCYRELYLMNKDTFTRIMCLKSTLALLNFNIYNSYQGNNLLSNLRLFFEAIPLIQSFQEVKMLFAVFLKREWKDRFKNEFLPFFKR